MSDSVAVESESDPVFVCGPPRSGVRLLATILDGHAALGSGPELPFVVTMAQQWRDLDATLGINHEKNYDLPRGATRQAFRSAMLQLFAERLRRKRKQAFVYHSFAAALCMDALGAIFPHAKFIVTMRDPRAIAHSLLRCDWRNPRTGEPLPYTLDTEAGARFVTDFVQTILRAASAPALRSRVSFLRYEDLCRQSTEVLAQLATFLAIEPIGPAISATAAAEIAASADAPHPPLRPSTIDAESIARWRTSLSANDIGKIETHAGPLFRVFGYVR